MKIITSTTTKFLLLAFLLSSGFFMGAGRVEADTQDWAYQNLSGYSNCSADYASQQTCTAYTAYGDSGDICTAYADIPLVSPYDIWTTYTTSYGDSGDTTTYKQCQSSTATYQQIASFSATDGGMSVNTYAPGATVSVSVLAGTGAGNSFNGWDPINNGILNFLFGSSTKAVGADAYYGSVNFAHCAETGSCTGSGTFIAPTTPGTYTINLRGWWYVSDDNNYSATSSMTFKVACASGTNWNGSSCVSCVSPNTWNTTTKTCDVPIVPGVCGKANGKTYPSDATGYSPDTQCSVGDSTNTLFPPAGGTYAWLCDNNGSFSPMCQAWRFGYTLSVGTNGTGTGAVTGSGITCTRPSAGGDICSLSFVNNTSVTLTASTTNGSTFTGWSGACSGTGNCTVTMDVAKSVVATFTTTTATVVTSMTVDGSTNNLTSCPGVSHALVWSATNVGGTCGGFGYAPVNASPNAGGSTSFSATSNGTISYNCPNSADAWGTQRDINVSVVDGSSCCNVGSHLAAGQTYWNGFACVVPPVSYFTLSIGKVGAGTVQSGDNPKSINCGSGVGCSSSYIDGTFVTLTATPDNGSSFTSWTGCDSTSSNACTVMMSGDKTVLATFTLPPPGGATAWWTPSAITIPYGGTLPAISYDSTSAVSCSIYDKADGSFITSAFGTSHTFPVGTFTGSPFTTSSWGRKLVCFNSANEPSSNAFLNVTVCAIGQTVVGGVCTTPSVFYTLSVGTNGAGTGKVTGSSINCTRPSAGGDTCSLDFSSGTSVTLTATPSSGNSVSWTGCDSTLNNTCTVAMSGDKTVLATFAMILTPVAGMCGSVNGTTVPSLTSGSANLCSASTPTLTSGSFSGTGPWSWTCDGVNGGGKSLSCTAIKGCVPNCSPTTASTICSDQSFSNGCGGTCTGTRVCGSSWKEVAP